MKQISFCITFKYDRHSALNIKFGFPPEEEDLVNDLKSVKLNQDPGVGSSKGKRFRKRKASSDNTLTC